jgi:hypothetical protein
MGKNPSKRMRSILKKDTALEIVLLNLISVLPVIENNLDYDCLVY